MVKLTEGMVIARSRSTDLGSVRKLNCWGSELSDVSLLRQMANVEVLSLSVNNIKTLADFQYCRNLQELYIRKNLINDLTEICFLQDLPKLRYLWLEDNPCAVGDRYRLTVLKYLPHLQKLDNIVVQPEEVRDADEYGVVLTHPEDKKEGFSSSPVADAAPPVAASQTTTTNSHTASQVHQVTVSVASQQQHHRQSLELDVEGNVCSSREPNTGPPRYCIVSPSEAQHPHEKRGPHQQEWTERHVGNNSEHAAEYGVDERVTSRNMRNLRSPPYSERQYSETAMGLELLGPEHKPREMERLDAMPMSHEARFMPHPHVPQHQQSHLHHQQVLDVHSDVADDYEYKLVSREEVSHRYGQHAAPHHLPAMSGPHHIAIAPQHKHRTCTPPLDKILDSPNKPYPIRPKNRNSNILSAVLCLIKELDYASLEVVEMAVRCRMEEMED